MKNIKDYDLQDLKEELVSIGEKSFRAEQIFKWLYQDKVKNFDEAYHIMMDKGFAEVKVQRYKGLGEMNAPELSEL